MAAKQPNGFENVGGRSTTIAPISYSPQEDWEHKPKGNFNARDTDVPTMEDWEKQIEEIVHRIYMNEDLIGGARDIKSLLLSHEQKIREEERKKALKAISEAFYDGVEQGGTEDAGDAFVASDYLEE